MQLWGVVLVGWFTFATQCMDIQRSLSFVGVRTHISVKNERMSVGKTESK